MRMTQHTDTGNLIIKLMPSVDHKAAHLDLAELFQGPVAQMEELHIPAPVLPSKRIPLVLEFRSLFLRTPVAPEGDVIFNTALLSEWANLFWDL